MSSSPLFHIPERGVLLGDGGISTSLQAMGLPTDALPEAWCLEHPERVAAVHRRFAEAGAGWSTTNTFGAHRPRLQAFGLERRLREICRAAVECARAGAPGTPVLGCIGPVLDADPLRFYEETVEALAEAGVDAFLVETIVSLQAGRAAVEAAVRAGAGPVIASVTPGEDGNLLDGTALEEAARAFFGAGAAAAGLNCGSGLERFLEPVRRLVALQEGPVLAAPNAGLPSVSEGRATYSLQPDSFARAAIQFAEVGVRLVAGCCGVAPEHLQAASVALKS